MYSCKVATEMVEKKNIVGLSFFENLKLRVHLIICSACKAYKTQSELIDAIIAKETINEDTPIIENAELKRTILARLKKE